MNKKEFTEFKSRPLEDINKELLALEEKLGALSFDLVLGKVKNIREVRKIKKSIAQLLTLKSGI